MDANKSPGIAMQPRNPSVDLSLFLPGKLLVGNEFFHNAILLVISAWMIAESWAISAPQSFMKARQPLFSGTNDSIAAYVMCCFRIEVENVL